MMYPYSYTILRYVHDTTTGEFVNVGVAIYAPGQRYVGAKCRTAYSRVSRAFPGADAQGLRQLVQHVERGFLRLGEQLRSDLPFEKAPKSVMDLAQQVLPADDSALQWSPAGGGLTSDPAAELQKLYTRLVARYDERPQSSGRSDEDIWKAYKPTLEARNLLRYFTPKTIAVQDDEVTFEHAWKNGVWHCLEPLSFDLSTADGIRDKAHRWLGHLTSVQDAQEVFKVILLLGEPSDAALKVAFENAKSILGKLKVGNEIVVENDIPSYTERLAALVEKHENVSAE